MSVTPACYREDHRSCHALRCGCWCHDPNDLAHTASYHQLHRPGEFPDHCAACAEDAVPVRRGPVARFCAWLGDRWGLQ